MQIETVPIDTIQPDPSNVRRHPDRNLTAIKGSLTRFGQQRPIVVDSRGIIIAGNGTHAAAKALGWSEIQIIRTALAGSEATAFAIADNRTGESSEWDQQALADALAALQAEDADLAATTGYTLTEIAKLIGESDGDGVANDPDTQWEGMPECVSEDLTPFASIKINFASAVDREAFSTLIGQTITENTRSLWYPAAAIGHTANLRYADAP